MEVSVLPSYPFLSAIAGEPFSEFSPDQILRMPRLK